MAKIRRRIEGVFDYLLPEGFTLVELLIILAIIGIIAAIAIPNIIEARKSTLDVGPHMHARCVNCAHCAICKKPMPGE